MLQIFNAFGEARVKRDSILLTVSALENQQPTPVFHNEVEVIDIDPELTIPENDPVRFLFASYLEKDNRSMTVKRQVSGRTLSKEEEKKVDDVIALIVTQLSRKVF